MADFLTPAERSARMARIRSRDTRPELVVRRMLHGLGYRYRLHSVDIPGRPDIVFNRKHKVVFVHGCFWHGHACQKRPMEALPPYWQAKITRNMQRDAEVLPRLEAAGWSALVVWECETRKSCLPSLRRRLQEFLELPA